MLFNLADEFRGFQFPVQKLPSYKYNMANMALWRINTVLYEIMTKLQQALDRVETH